MSKVKIVLENAELMEEHLEKNISSEYKNGNNEVNVDGNAEIRIIVSEKNNVALKDEDILDEDKRIELGLGIKIAIVNKVSKKLEVEYRLRYNFIFDILDDEVKQQFLYGKVTDEVEVYVNNMVNLGYANIRNGIQDIFLRGKLGYNVPYTITLKGIE